MDVEGARNDADCEEPLERSIMTLEGCGREKGCGW